MSESNPTDQLTPIVSRYLDISEFTLGGGSMNYVMRYRGELKIDSAEAYDKLAADLYPLKLTPLFRIENGQHTVILMDGVFDPQPSNPWVNLVLFLLTLVSMLIAGVIFSYDGPVPEGILGTVGMIFENIELGFPFGLSLLAILLAHEFGHYFAGRLNKTAVTLPYFIPLPLSPFGTMGAFIQLKEPPKNKRVLLDIGIAGPLAGLVITIPVLIIGVALSKVEDLPLYVEAGTAFSLEGNSILYLLVKYLVHGEMLPAPDTYIGVNPIWHWVKYFFTGLPTPLGGKDIMLHPVAWAGWAGLLVTGLNLIPAGQLDGGHVLYVLFGKKAKNLLPVVLVALTLLGFAWGGWWLWVFLILIFGRVHAEPLDQITTLDRGRMILAVLALVIFVLIFIPVPLRLLTGPYVGP